MNRILLYTEKGDKSGFNWGKGGYNDKEYDSYVVNVISANAAKGTTVSLIGTPFENAFGKEYIIHGDLIIVPPKVPCSLCRIFNR